jgi:mono/diheme cytochrome c family protein
MPSHHYWVLSDDDVSAMIAYLESVPAVDATPAPTSVRGLGRFLFVTGRLPLVPAELIDHEAPRPVAPAPAVTAEYGEYLATGCRGCHGELLGGGPIVGAPADRPMAANLTPDERSGLGSWERDDFFRALREGRRPDGSTIDPIMPWQNTSAMTDLEIDALWTYLQAVPAWSGSSESPDR